MAEILQSQQDYGATTINGDHVALTYKPLDEQEHVDRVRDASAGAICTFTGTTRDSFKGTTDT